MKNWLALVLFAFKQNIVNLMVFAFTQFTFYFRAGRSSFHVTLRNKVEQESLKL